MRAGQGRSLVGAGQPVSHIVLGEMFVRLGPGTWLSCRATQDRARHVAVALRIAQADQPDVVVSIPPHAVQDLVRGLCRVAGGLGVTL